MYVRDDVRCVSTTINKRLVALKNRNPTALTEGSGQKQLKQIQE